MLKAIIKSPDQAPRSLIFQGAYGTGKTTAARIFARALNCKDSHNGEPCGVCSVCKEDLSSSPFYQEYDSAVVGNVERTRELRDTFYNSLGGAKRVIVLDECHLASNAAQNAFLKSIEEGPKGVFFIFATTDIDKVIPTIRSRSLELQFFPVPHEEVVANLRGVLGRHGGVDCSDRALNTIAVRSRGHMRNAHIFLDNLLLLGESGFLESVRSAGSVFLDFFHAVAVKDREAAFSSLGRLGTYPLADLLPDFQQTILEMTQVYVGYKQDDGLMGETVKALGPNTLKLVRHSVSEWVIGSFASDQAFQACMLCLFQLFAGSSAPAAQVNPLAARMGKNR